MTKAIAPDTMPTTPEEFRGWWRSARRGSAYHLIGFLGDLACNPSRSLERNRAIEARHVGDIQYWGACPHCLRKAGA